MDWLHWVTSPHALESLSGAALPAIFAALAAAGLLMGLAPSTLAVAPVVAGLVVGQCRGRPWRSLAMSVAFVLGIATVDAVLGALFGILGEAAIGLAAKAVPLWDLLIAVMLAFMGLALTRTVSIRLPILHHDLAEPKSLAGAYALGIPFGLSTCPACTPMVLPALGAAAVSGSIALGAALLFVFGLARGLPLVVAGISTGAIQRAKGLSRRVALLERAVGWLLLGAAVFFALQAVRLSGLF